MEGLDEAITRSRPCIAKRLPPPCCGVVEIWVVGDRPAYMISNQKITKSGLQFPPVKHDAAENVQIGNIISSNPFPNTHSSFPFSSASCTYQSHLQPWLEMEPADSTDTRHGEDVFRDLVNCHARTARCEILHQLYFLLLETCATIPWLALGAPCLRLPDDLKPLVVTAALVYRPTLRGS